MSLTPEQLVEAVRDAGAEIVLRDGRHTIRGSLPDELVLGIRSQREAFLEAWDQAEAKARASRGWGTLPDPVTAIRRKAPAWPAREYRAMERWTRRQPDSVCRWVFERAGEYRSRRGEWNEREALSAAMLDLWEWQAGKGHANPGSVVAGLEEATK